MSDAATNAFAIDTEAIICATIFAAATSALAKDG
jgi:hypothetical protein